MPKVEPHFAVDVAGLRKVLGKKALSFLIRELVQNAWDQNITRCDIRVYPSGRGYHTIEVEDDDPNGFMDLAHAYTFFAESWKKDDPTKRGRYNVGEKWVIAVCKEAQIETTTGTVHFDDAGRTRSKRKRDRGSVFWGKLQLTQAQYAEVEESIRHLLPPKGITTTFNGKELLTVDPLEEFEVILPTVISDALGNLTKTERVTTVRVYDGAGDNAHIYEMGIPVVQIPDRFDVDIQQKVPMPLDRDNVPPAYLRRLRAAVLNNTHHLLTEEDAGEKWVDHALEDKSIDAEAIKTTLDKRHTEERVIYDPSDREANNLSMSGGKTLMYGSSYSKAAWDNIRRATDERGATFGALPAGQVTPSPRPFSDDPNAPVLKEVERDNWTPAMERFERYAQMLAKELMGVNLTVRIASDLSWPFGGAYGDGMLTVNYARHGRRWFEEMGWQMDSFLIHEFGHQYESNHLDAGYYRALTKLGAKMVELALTKPELFAVKQEVPSAA